MKQLKPLAVKSKVSNNFSADKSHRRLTLLVIIVRLRMVWHKTGKMPEIW